MPHVVRRPAQMLDEDDDGDNQPYHMHCPTVTTLPANSNAETQVVSREWYTFPTVLPSDISIEVERPPFFSHFLRMFYRIFLLFSVLMLVVRIIGFADLLTLCVCFCARGVRVCLSIFVLLLPNLSLSYLICLSHFISLYI